MAFGGGERKESGIDIAVILWICEKRKLYSCTVVHVDNVYLLVEWKETIAC